MHFRMKARVPIYVSVGIIIIIIISDSSHIYLFQNILICWIQCILRVLQSRDFVPASELDVVHIRHFS